MDSITTPRMILELLRAEGPMLTRQLAARLALTQPHIARVCRCLCKKGCISSVEGMHGLTEKGREAIAGGRYPCRRAEAKGSLRQKAWNVMRMRDSFSIEDLLLTVCNGEEKDAKGNLTQFCAALHAAGILKRTRRTNAYFLPRGQGPLCPAYNRPKKYVVDRNTGEVFRLGESL